MKPGIATAIGIVVVLLAPATAGAAATITVNTTADEIVNPGLGCSLREAIQSVNNAADFGGCVNTAGAYGVGTDGITLPAGTFTLSIASTNEDLNANGDLDLAKTVAIAGVGDGAGGTTIDANDIDRVIDVLVNGSASNAFQVFGVRIEDGNTAGHGGGIRNSDPDGSTLVQNSTLASNHAGGWGGGIAANGNMFSGLGITRTELSGNSADGDGGGLWRAANGGATGLVQESLFAGNTSGGKGGAIYQQGDPLLTNGVNYRNTTFSANSAALGGGAIGLGAAGAQALLNFTTLTGNSTPTAGAGGAIFGDAATMGQIVRLEGTVLAANLAAGVDASCGSGTGSPVSYFDDGYNLESANTCQLNTAAPDLSLINTNPLLAPLAGNGGETRTHGLYDTSPAMNRIPAGAECADSTYIDQRNTTRPVPMGGNCDVGAFEGSVGPVPITPVTPVTPITPLTPPTPTTPKKKCKKKKKGAAAAKKCRKKK